MNVGPKIHPASVDADDGSLNVSQVAVFLEYGPGNTPSHVDVYDPGRNLILSADIVSFVQGAQPRMVSGRHVAELADGRRLYIKADGGCGCGSRLKGWYPGVPATSGRRP